MLENNQDFWIEHQELSNGLEKLSGKIDGKHYVGFLDWYERKETDGTTKRWKSARMRPCEWDKCNICHPEINEKEIF